MGRTMGQRDVAPRVKRARITEEMIVAAGDAYAGGLSLREVAARLGLSYGGAHSAVVASGVQLRPRGAMPPPPMRKE